ncbi:putative coiled-coil domain-containing protein 195 [Nycticebus coucang]|uniref:putative coiled-coil domain-containing protein 195 n=1 Tax=Nycticebus coucang TaxID=9470 RepID=UPI00234DE2A4|nr:putative coiled-coil domain-containing protein 195 [Nycticebus coucang]
MEAPNIQLLIQDMRAEITKLQKENQALRTKLTSSSRSPSGSGGESGEEREEEAPEHSPATVPGAVSTDSAPGAARPHPGNTMIVRRYSISSSAHSSAVRDPWKVRKRHPNSRILEAQRTCKSLACSSIKKQDNEEMIAADSVVSNNASQRASPERGFGCRNKIKAVSFLLPMDMSSYSRNSSSLKYSPNNTTDQLSIIAE